MTFNTSLKEEISKNEYSLIEARCELEAFIKCNSKITNKNITITVENASVARKIYKNIKLPNYIKYIEKRRTFDIIKISYGKQSKEEQNEWKRYEIR